MLFLVVKVCLVFKDRVYRVVKWVRWNGSGMVVSRENVVRIFFLDLGMVKVCYVKCGWVMVG